MWGDLVLRKPRTQAFLLILSSVKHMAHRPGKRYRPRAAQEAELNAVLRSSNWWPRSPSSVLHLGGCLVLASFIYSRFDLVMGRIQGPLVSRGVSKMVESHFSLQKVNMALCIGFSKIGARI